MKELEMTALIEGLHKLSADVAQIADALEEKTKISEAEQPGTEPAPKGKTEQTVEEQTVTEMPEAEPTPEGKVEQTVTEMPAKKSFEEVRGILAEKARAGFRAEVKALLSARGVSRLSDITDPADLASLASEAEVIGNG